MDTFEIIVLASGGLGIWGLIRQITRCRFHAIDGDTFICMRTGTKYRLRGVDTPELKGPSRDFGIVAKTTLQKYLDKGIKVESRGRTSYGRIVCYAFCRGKNVSHELVRLGVGRVMDIDLKKSEKEAFISLETEAKRKKRGVWCGKTVHFRGGK